MKEFNLLDLANLYFSGYRYILITTKRDHVTLKPLKNQVNDSLVKKMGVVQLPILHDEIKQLADGIAWLPAFLPEDFYELNENSYVLS